GKQEVSSNDRSLIRPVRKSNVFSVDIFRPLVKQECDWWTSID
ncbi:unnamed protein product, partial [Schistosoma margrebowiei]